MVAKRKTPGTSPKRKTKPPEDKTPFQEMTVSERKVAAKKSRAMCRWPKASYQRTYDNPAEMEQGIIDYFDTCVKLFRPYTWGGLAVHLGMANRGLFEYYAGKRGDTEEDKQQFVDLLTMAKQVIEASKEEMALLGLYHPAFTKFDLKNQHGWQDHTSVDVNNPTVHDSDEVDATDPIEASKQYMDIMTGANK